MKKILGWLIIFIVIGVAASSLAFFITSFSLKANSRMLPALSHVDAKSAPKKEKQVPEKVLLDVPVILQMPELPRGCEVTSLAMMLNYAGINVSKMELADKIKKIQYEQDGLNGSPYEGFVGSMYNLGEPGLGVYHKPIAELAEQYIPYKVVNLTGEEFYWILKYLDRGRPVWVINNITFNVLGDEDFVIWNTPKGRLKVTFKEHSVLVTGYDSEYIYFNDPRTGEKNKAVPKSQFIESWKQMGSQAVTYNR